MNQMHALKELKPNALKGLQSLERHRLSGCISLTSIQGRTPLRKLSHLDLSDNQLSSVDENLLDWQQLKFLNLAGNRWNCNCEMLSFLPSVLRAMGNEITAYCSGPERLVNVRLDEASNIECSSMDNQLLQMLALSSLAFMILTLLMLFIVCILRKRHVRCCCIQCGSPSISNKSRVPLYVTGSSFSESLVYEKTADNSALFKANRGKYAGLIVNPGQPANYAEQSVQDNSSEYYSSILMCAGPQDVQIHPNARSHTLHAKRNVGPLTPPPFYSTSSTSHPNFHQQVEHCEQCAIAPCMTQGRTPNRPPSFTAPPPPPPTVPPPCHRTLHRLPDGVQYHWPLYADRQMINDSCCPQLYDQSCVNHQNYVHYGGRQAAEV